MRETYTIYQIFCEATGKSYVGMTNDFKRRKRQHLSDLKNYKHRSILLQLAYDNYGKKSFSWHVLEKKLPSHEIACEAEIYWIEQCNSYEDGYNMTMGGEITPHTGISCIWNNVEYKSIAEAARVNGVSPEGMYRRVASGYTCDNDLRSNVEIHGIPCIWNGIGYSSISEAARDNEITVQAMWGRLQNGYTCDDDVPEQTVLCTWNGIEYESISEAARAIGIKPNSMSQRLQQGYTCDEDMIGKKKVCIWNGIEYESIATAARANGVKPNSMSQRLSKGYTCNTDLNQWANED